MGLAPLRGRAYRFTPSRGSAAAGAHSKINTIMEQSARVRDSRELLRPDSPTPGPAANRTFARA